MATRTEFFRKLGVITPGPDLDAVTEQAYLLEEDKAHKKDNNRKPSGRAFYASMFPGGVDERRCARHALYTMIGTPNPEPIKPMGRAVIEMGKAAEKQIVWRWGRMGLLLGNIDVPDREDKYLPQLAFQDPDTWLAGYADAVLDIRPRWKYVLPVDVKSKSHEKVQALKAGAADYDPDHYKQLQAYIYLCRKYHEFLGWDKMGLLPAAGGFIYYVSRDNPRFTKPFYVPYDEQFVNAGIERLAEWKQNFLNDELPERPKSWRWTQPPCQYCNLKKLCKQDTKDGVTVLSKSNVVQLSERLIEGFDLDKVRKEVMKRWMQQPLSQS